MATPNKLPLKLQVAVRDLWDKPGAPVQDARAQVARVLGFPVRCDPDWAQLLAVYDAATPPVPLYADDRAALVAAVAGCVEVWCRVLADLLNDADADSTAAADPDPALQAWAEAVVECLGPDHSLRLFVEVAGARASGTGGAAKTAWLPDRAAFVLRLPAHEAVVVPSDEALAYREGLLNCFAKPPPPPPGPVPVRLGNTSDDWADVAVDDTTGTAAVVEPPPAAAASSSAAAPFSSSSPSSSSAYAHLPSVASLPRPEDLLRRPPYHLRITNYSTQKIVVDGSHSPSLRLLGAYLERWCRTNHADSRTPAAVETKYRASCWATSTQTIDQVALSTADNSIFTISPPIVLAFVEGVLGYTLVHTDGAIWTYRRDQPFKE